MLTSEGVLLAVLGRGGRADSERHASGLSREPFVNLDQQFLREHGLIRPLPIGFGGEDGTRWDGEPGGGGTRETGAFAAGKINLRGLGMVEWEKFLHGEWKGRRVLRGRSQGGGLSRSGIGNKPFRGAGPGRVG